MNGNISENIYKASLSSYAALFRENNILLETGGDSSVALSYLSYDTRDIKENTLFFCKGVHFKTEYLSDAERLGAVAYVSETKYDSSLPYILVSDIRKAMSLAAFNDMDGRFSSLSIIGVTGTKGKSTVSYYIKAILDRYLEKETGIISSIENYDGVINEDAKLTTPEAIQIGHHLENAVNSGITHFTMEVSSQALKYGRVEGIEFAAACFTNIGKDHISPIEHPDFEDYFYSKLKIFDSCRVACVNTDAEHSDKALSYVKKCGCRVITFGSHENDTVYVSNVRKEQDGIYFDVKAPSFSDTFRITMSGFFNVENAAAAIAVCLGLGIPAEYMKRGLDAAKVKGRMEIIPSSDGRIITIVDYAHNKLSFEALLKSVKKEFPDKKIVMVFGCAGGKAFSRRKDLGEIAGKYADYSIVSEDDSGEEPFSSISAQISKYISESGGSYSVIETRKEAIYDAVFNHGLDKVVLVLGRGREPSQKRGTGYVETPSDYDYSVEYMKQYDSTVRVLEKAEG